MKTHDPRSNRSDRAFRGACVVDHRRKEAVVSVFDQLKSAGILDARWQLPLGAGGGRDNIAKDTAVAIALEKPEDRQAWRDRIYLFLMSSVLRVGLYVREPGNLNRNSVDNLIGTIVASKLIGSGSVAFADVIHERGEKMNWTYSVAYPDTAFNPFLPWRYKVKQDWYGRFPGFPPFVRLACGAPVQDDGLSLFYASVRVTCGTPKDNTSDKVLMWLQWQVIPQEHYLIKEAYEYWKKAMTEQYGDLGGLMAVYYGADHPFTVAARGRSF
jgi:hypothetical protein